MRNPYEHDDTPPACADCNDPDAPVVMIRKTNLWEQRIAVCLPCADRFAGIEDGSGTAEAVDYERDGGEAA